MRNDLAHVFSFDPAARLVDDPVEQERRRVESGEATQRRAAAIQDKAVPNKSLESIFRFEDTAPAPIQAQPTRTAAINKEPTAETPVVTDKPGGFWDRLSREPKYLGSALERGWNNILSSVNGMKMSEYGEFIEKFNNSYTPEQIAASPELQAKKREYEQNFARLAQESAELSRKNEEILKSDRTRPESQQMFGAGKPDRGWAEAASEIGGAIVRDPGSVVDLALTSGPSTLASMASAIAVFLATRNPIAAAAAGGATSGYVEFGNEYAGNRAEGMSHEEAWKTAALKSSVIGLADAVSMKTAGRALDTVVDAVEKGATRTAVKTVAKETGRQAALGAGGEAGGSLAAGKDIDPTNVLLEAVGETVSAPAEAVTTSRRFNRMADSATADINEKVDPVAPVPSAKQPGTTVQQPTTTVDSILTGSSVDPAAPTPVATTTGTNQENQAPITPESAQPADTATAVLVAEPVETTENQAQIMSQVVPTLVAEGTVTSKDLDAQLSEVDAEATAQLAASQMVEETPEPPSVPPDRQIQVNLGNDGSRFVVFEDSLHKQLFQLGSRIRQAFSGRPEILKDIDGLTQYLSAKLKMDPQQLRQFAVNYRESVVAGSRLVEVDGTFQAPVPGATNPILQSAVQEINQEFNLTGGESVQIQEAPANKRMSTIAKAIKQAFGTDVVWVNFGENQQITTNRGRSFGAFNGMRVGGRNAILLDASNPQFLNTLGHELTHVLETKYPQIYAQLVALARERIPAEAQTALRNRLSGAMQRESGRVLDEALFESELVAEMIGEQAIDPQFWIDVFNSSADRTFAQDFINTIQDIIKKLLAVMQGPQFVKDRKDLIAVREAATQAFQQWIQQEQTSATDTQTTNVPSQPGQFARALNRSSGKSETDPIVSRDEAYAINQKYPASDKRKGRCHELSVVKVVMDFGNRFTQVLGVAKANPVSRIWHSVVRDPETNNIWEPISDRWYTPEAMDIFGFEPVLEKTAAEVRREASSSGVYPDQGNYKPRGWEQDYMRPGDYDPDYTITGYEPEADPITQAMRIGRQMQQTRDQQDDVQPTQQDTAPTQFSRKTADQVVSDIADGKPLSSVARKQYPEIAGAYDKVVDFVEKKAPTVNAKFEQMLKRLAQQAGGKVKMGPIKKVSRAYSKVYFDYGNNVDELNDVVRATLVLDNIDQIPGAIAQAQSMFEGSFVKRNLWAEGAEPLVGGYRDVMFRGVAVDGMRVELQMNVQEMIDAKDVAHKWYKESEELTRKLNVGLLTDEESRTAQEKIQKLTEQQSSAYSVAFNEANRSRNSASLSGTPSESSNIMLNGTALASFQRKGNASPGRNVTGTPLTSANSVPAGNEFGIGTDVTPVGTLNDIVNQQNDRDNPLLSAVDEAEAEGRVRRRENRKENIGAPVNDRVVFAKEGKTFAVGKITIQDWIGRVNDLMTTEELKDSRTWYRQLDNAFRPIFKDNVAQYALAWLLSQKRASPSKGFTDVLRAADMAAGKAEVKKAGLNQQALIDVLQGRVPQEGVGAKLLDFLDSELGRTTRTVVRDDPRGRQPAAIDVWAQRDIGFVDPKVFEYVRKEFGEDAVAQLDSDRTTDGEAQYEYGIDFYNDVVEYLNETNFDGGGWTAREVQAVGWVTMQKAMGVKAEFVRDIIGMNTRRISIGLAPGPDSVLAGKLVGKEIPVEVAQREIDYLANLAGVNIVQNVNGVGAYLQWIEGAIQIDAVASPEAIADFMDMVGYAFQQTEIINTRALASGKNMAVDILADGLTTVEQSTAFFSKFLEYGPKDKNGEPLAPGFQQIILDGVPGIRLLNLAGNWRQTQVAEIYDALNTVASDLNVQLQDVVVKQVVLKSTKNDWKENSDGQAYLNSLRDRGRLQEAGELVRRYPPSRVDVAGDGTISWNRGPNDTTGGQTRAQFSRANLNKMVEGAPDAPDGVVLGFVPPVLQAVGVQRLPLVITKDKVVKIVTPERVGKVIENRTIGGREVAPRIPLSVDQLYALPQLLADPVAILKSSERSSTGGKGLVIITSAKVDGYPVIATISEKASMTVVEGERFEELQVTEITTALPKNQTIPSGGTQMSPLNRDLAQNALYFNKERGAQLAQGLRLSLPRLRTGTSNPNVLLPEGIVKRYGESAFRFERVDIPIQRIRGGSRFSRNQTPTLAEDMQRQMDWVQEQSELAGYKDADEFIEKDYDGFIRIATKWREQNPTYVLFSRTIPPVRGNRFALPGFGRLRGLVRGIQNEVGRAAQVQKAVAEQGGILTDATDIESAMHRMYGRGGSRLDDFRKKIWQPLLDKAAKDRVSFDDVALYMYATHAPEANAQVASINATYPDGGSGMTNQEAADILKDLRQDPVKFAKTKQYADQVQAITRLTQRVLVNGDIVSQDNVDAWNATYKYYVPLKTFEQVDSSGSTTNSGRFDLAQEFSKRRLGRSTRAGAIIENILTDYEDAIVAVERNNVRKAWLKFILDNRDSKLWQVNRPVMTRAFFKNPIEEVRYRLGIQSDQNTLPVRVGGKVYHMVIEDAETRRDLEMSSVLSGTSDGFKHFFGMWSGINRTLGKLWTALSPAFILINSIRDTQTALINSGVEQGFGSSLKILKTLPGAAYTILRAERNGNWAGTGSLKQIYDQYKADGGKTGFLDLKQLEDRQAEVIAAFRNAQASIGNPLSYHRLVMRYLKAAEDMILDVNGAIEGAARVAAYKAALESGKSRIEATNIAKEITVNFNRRGRWTPVMSSLYLFFNPAVQGAVRTGKAVFSKRGAVAASGLVGLGYMVAMMAAQATGDDDEPYWDKPSYRTQKLKNLMFMGADGDTYTVPLPYGLGFFVSLGYAIKDLERGIDPWKVSAFLRDAFFIHFSPLGAAENMATFVSPTIVDPIYVLASGQREDGMPLMPADFSGIKPDSERYWNNSRDSVFQNFTSWMNEVTGGSPARAGKVDVSPESLNYITTFVTGGLGTFVKDVVQTVDLFANVGADAPLEQNKIPILRALYKNETGRADASAFYENVKKAEVALEEWKVSSEIRDKATDSMLDRVAENRRIAMLGGATDNYKKALAALRMEDIKIQTNDTLDRATKFEMRKNVAEKMRKLQVDFNRQFYQGTDER